MHLHCATAETIRISGSEPSRIAGPRNAGSGRVANVNVKDLEIPSASFDGKKRSRVGTIQVDEGMRYSGWKSRCGLNKEFLDLVFGVQISTLPPTHVKPRVLLWQSQDEGYRRLMDHFMWIYTISLCPVIDFAGLAWVHQSSKIRSASWWIARSTSNET
ncbi:hypothetical protein AcV5_009847 [Taiwanofungus camphoratus]|nr:hypothetical protein AcV5_009847 [Antrodia cinnamomea]